MRQLLAAMLLSALTGQVATADVLQEIRERGLIRLGVRADAPPFSYHDDNGAPQGLAVALCQEVSRRIGNIGIEFVTVTAADRFKALAERRTDLHCGPASATLSRRDKLDFSLLYFVDGAAPASRPGVYEIIFERKKGTFGVLQGTTSEAVARDLIVRNDIDAKIIQYTSHIKGLGALADGNLDIYLGDQAILVFQTEAQGLSEKITVREDLLSFEPYALAMRRGESGLRLEVDRALSEIYDEGKIYDLIDVSLGDFPLPDGANAIYEIVALPK